MTLVHANRRHLGWFLLIGIPLFIAILGFGIREGDYGWLWLFMLPPGCGLGFLIWQFITNSPVIVIGAGRFQIRFPFRSVGIPLQQIKAVHIRQPWGADGKYYFLEIALHSATPETERLLRSFMKRQIAKEAQRSGGYQPPEEPYLIVQTCVLGLADAELGRMVEIEQSKIAVTTAKGPISSPRAV
jgi:hypothetical protein